MGLFDFFKRKGNKKQKNLNPSKEHLEFSQEAKRVIGKSVEKFGFSFHREEIEEWFTTIIYRKKKQYIKISASNHWRDQLSHYNLILGEGNSEEFSEWDWNSIVLWRIKENIDPKLKAKEYTFPVGDKIKYSIENADKELLKYGKSFLEGDLNLFHEVRKIQNQKREPYKIYSADEKGNYKVEDEPKSKRQKKKFS